jgi:hypothetical protein
MGGGFSVNPDLLHGAAGRTRARASDFVSNQPPEVGDGDWPTQQATRRFHARVAGANQGFSARMGDTADATADAANLYQQQDQPKAADASAVSAKDAAGIISGVIKDITGAVTGAIGPLMSAVAGGAAALGSATASGAGALANSAAQVAGQAAVTQAKMNATTEGGAGVSTGIGAGGGAGGGGAGGGATPAGQKTQVQAAGLAESRADPMPQDQIKAGLPADGQGHVVPAAAPMSVPRFAVPTEHHAFSVKVHTVHTSATPTATPTYYDDQSVAEDPATVVVSVAPKWSKP